MEKTLIEQSCQEETGLGKNLTKCSFKNVKKTFHKWLYIEDDLSLDVIYATVLANMFQGDPTWLLLIAGSGGCKTELLRALGSSDQIYMLSSLTSRSLISGLKTDKDPSLIPQLDGKILVIKDFTTVLNTPQEAKAQIIGDLRDAYDGQCGKAFGTGQTRTYKSKFGLIAGVTPVIEKEWAVQAELGERFLRFRIRLSDRESAAEQAMKNAGYEEEMRSELSAVSKDFLDCCRIPPIGEIKISSDIQSRTLGLAELVALARSRVSRNGRDCTINYAPAPEIATRLVKQFKLLGAGSACLYGKRRVGEKEYNLIRRVAIDTLPSREAKILETLYCKQMEKDIPYTTQEIGDQSRFSTETCRRTLEDYWLLEVVHRHGTGAYKWQLKPSFRALCEQTGIFLPS